MDLMDRSVSSRTSFMIFWNIIQHMNIKFYSWPGVVTNLDLNCLLEHKLFLQSFVSYSRFIICSYNLQTKNTYYLLAHTRTRACTRGHPHAQTHAHSLAYMQIIHIRTHTLTRAHAFSTPMNRRLGLCLLLNVFGASVFMYYGYVLHH